MLSPLSPFLRNPQPTQNKFCSHSRIFQKNHSKPAGLAPAGFLCYYKKKHPLSRQNVGFILSKYGR